MNRLRLPLAVAACAVSLAAATPGLAAGTCKATVTPGRLVSAGQEFLIAYTAEPPAGRGATVLIQIGGEQLVRDPHQPAAGESTLPLYLTVSGGYGSYTVRKVEAQAYQTTAVNVTRVNCIYN